MKFNKHIAVSAVAALFVSTSAGAQMFGDGRTDLGYDDFRTGVADRGVYDAWDTDATPGLSENEFATGVYSDWDTDNDQMITEDEFNRGSERWYGADYDRGFTDYDADRSGMIERTEFRDNWDSNYYSTWDTNTDRVLDEDEYTTGLYNAADRDRNQVITVEEEEWYEGWFDGDDVEAEIRETGDVLGS